MKRGCTLLFFLTWGMAGFCQEESVVTPLLQKGYYLDAFQYALQRDIYYTNFSMMLLASRLVLLWGSSTNGEDFSISNSTGETRTYYFPVALVLEPFTNVFLTNEILWELLVRYYDRGLQENWFTRREEGAGKLLVFLQQYMGLSKKPDLSLIAGQVPALFLLGQTNQSLDVATNLFRRYPRESRVVYVYADLLRKIGKGNEALKIIQQHYPYVKNPADRVSFTLLSGRLYLEEGNAREALFVLERALQFSTNRDILESILDAARQVNDWQRFTKRALLLFSLNPDDVSLLFLIARFFILAQQREWSEVFFERALEEYGENNFRRGMLYFYWGEVYRNLLFPQKALRAYEKAKEALMLVDPAPTESLATIEMMIYRVKTP
ncbi:MAG: tetratricopeptide repeat protein [Brevinematales bacterium]